MPQTTDTITVNSAELIDLAEEMIRIPSVSGDELRLAEFLVQWCTARGIDAELQYATETRPNVIARVPGNNGAPSLLLNGHIDMTEVLDIYEGDPYEPFIKDDYLHGAAISNMKGAVAGMFAALAAIKRAGGLDGDVILTAVVGECDLLGLGTKAALTAGITADAAINGEPTGNELVYSHAGLMQFELRLIGSPAHQQERHLGRNAVEDAAAAIQILDETKLTFEKHSTVGTPQLMAGRITGGVMPQVTAPEVSVFVDIRTVPGMTRQGILDDLHRMLADLPEGAKYEIDVFVYSDPFTLDTDSSITAIVRDAYQDVVGSEVVLDDSRWLGATDCSHLQAARIPTVLLGPGRFQMAEVYDRISIKEMVDAANIYAQAAAKFCRSAA